jgi:hypothetical protein
MTVYPNRCRSCNAAIRWEQTPAGRMAPISLATGVSHFIDCPQRRQWRKAPSRSAPRTTPPADTQPPLWDDSSVEPWER